MNPQPAAAGQKALDESARRDRLRELEDLINLELRAKLTLLEFQEAFYAIIFELETIIHRSRMSNIQNFWQATERRRNGQMRSLITTVALAGCCFAAGVALADGVRKGTQRGPAGIAEGEALLAARAKLLKQGWRPTQRHSSDGYEYSGAELQLTGQNIFEVDSCSMDSSQCILYYSKKGKCLRMDSIGEQLRDMTVTRWADECPAAPPKASAFAPD